MKWEADGLWEIPRRRWVINKTLTDYTNYLDQVKWLFELMEVTEDVAKAEIHITDKSGKLVKLIPINSSGKGTLNLRAEDFPSGLYDYTLFADGKLVATKKMMLSK